MSSELLYHPEGNSCTLEPEETRFSSVTILLSRLQQVQAQLTEASILFFARRPIFQQAVMWKLPYSWYVPVLLSLYPSTLHIHLIIRAGALPS